MRTLDRVEGHNISFRLVRPDDAAYIHGLRHSEEYGRYLSVPVATIEAQAAWIVGYKSREALGHEYYFIIERRDDGTRCGTIRLYDIVNDTLTWGSWILDRNKPSRAALDSVLLIYRIAFSILGCKTAFVDVRADNARSLAFQRRFGTSEIRSDDLNIYFKLDFDHFAKLAPALDRVLLSPNYK